MARTAGSVGQETAAAVREAARRLFAESGYAAVSMRAIAAEVGVQPGALYNHFPTKQAILVDLLRAHLCDLLERAAAALPADAPPEERLRAFTRFHIRHHLPRAEAVFVSYMELRALEPENFKEISSLRRRYELLLIDILRDGQAAGRFPIRDPAVTAMAVIAMLTGVTTWYRADGRLSGAAVEDIYAEMVERCVGLAPNAGDSPSKSAAPRPKESDPCRS